MYKLIVLQTPKLNGFAELEEWVTEYVNKEYAEVTIIGTQVEPMLLADGHTHSGIYNIYVSLRV